MAVEWQVFIQTGRVQGIESRIQVAVTIGESKDCDVLFWKVSHGSKIYSRDHSQESIPGKRV